MTKPMSYTGPRDDDLSSATIKLCLYSHPGEGKTVFWSSGGERVLFINSDPEGTISGSAQGNSFHQVDAYDWDDMDQVYDWLRGDKPQEFSWIVWDSLTLFQDAVLIDDIMPEAVARSKSGEQEEFVPSKREYLINMNRIGRMVRQLAKLPYNFGVSCHVMTTAESGGDGTIFMPQVQGKNMPSKIAGYCNVVGYLGKFKEGTGTDAKVVQKMLTRRQGRYYAKDRWDALGAELVRPTLPMLEGLIEAKRKKLIAARTGGTKSGDGQSASPAPAARRARARRAGK